MPEIEYKSNESPTRRGDSALTFVSWDWVLRIFPACVSAVTIERWKRWKPWWINSVWRGVWCISATLYLIPASKVSLKNVSVWYERTVTHVIHFICPLLQPFFQDDIAVGCSVQFLHGQTITWTASLFHFCMFHLSPAESSKGCKRPFAVCFKCFEEEIYWRVWTQQTVLVSS